MRKLALTAGVALALTGGVAAAQFVDPRTAAGAAGVIMGSPTPDEAPAAIDRSRDPADKGLGGPAAEAAERGQADTGRGAPQRETATTAEKEDAPVIDKAPTAPRPRPLATPPSAVTDRPR